MSDLLKAMQAKRQRLEGASIDVEVSSSKIPLDSIQDRFGDDTRSLNFSHVEQLAESIALLGLIEPLVLDGQCRLLAGGHRRAAISQLRDEKPDIYGKWFAEGVPVHRLNFDAGLQPDLAVQIEVAENEQRRDYTPAEVRAIADRFREAGFGVNGRPGKGQSPLIPALVAVVGKSRRTVQRYLEQGQEKSASDGVLSPGFDYEGKLRRGSKSLSQWLEKPDKTKSEQALAKQVKPALDAISAYLEMNRKG